MTIYLYLLVLFLNLIFAFRKKSSKLLTLITLIAILLFMGGAGPGYTFLSDYDNYQRSYENIACSGLFDSSQVGYTILMKAGNLLGLDFFAFRIIVTGICLLVIYQVIKRYSYNSNYILLLYMIYPMIIDSEHFRNFIAITVLLVAIRFLEKNLLKNKIKYLLLILIASTIHISFIFYIPLVFVNVNHKNKLIKGLAIGVGLLTVVAFLNNNQVPFVQSVINFIDNEKVQRYLGATTNFGFLIPVVLHLTSIILVFWSRRIIIRKDTNTMEEIGGKLYCNKKKRIKDIEFGNLVFWINILGVIFFPLYIMNIQFYRLSRNFLILNFIVYSIASNKIKRGSVYKLIFNSTVITSVFLWLVIDLVVRIAPERLLIPFFFQHLFLN